MSQNGNEVNSSAITNRTNSGGSTNELCQAAEHANLISSYAQQARVLEGASRENIAGSNQPRRWRMFGIDIDEQLLNLILLPPPPPPPPQSIPPPFLQDLPTAEPLYRPSTQVERCSVSGTRCEYYTGRAPAPPPPPARTTQSVEIRSVYTNHFGYYAQQSSSLPAHLPPTSSIVEWRSSVSGIYGADYYDRAFVPPAYPAPSAEGHSVSETRREYYTERASMTLAHTIQSAEVRSVYSNHFGHYGHQSSSQPAHLPPSPSIAAAGRSVVYGTRGDYYDDQSSLLPAAHHLPTPSRVDECSISGTRGEVPPARPLPSTETRGIFGTHGGYRASVQTTDPAPSVEGQNVSGTSQAGRASETACCTVPFAMARMISRNRGRYYSSRARKIRGRPRFSSRCFTPYSSSSSGSDSCVEDDRQHRCFRYGGRCRSTNEHSDDEDDDDDPPTDRNNRRRMMRREGVSSLSSDLFRM